jgi:HEAT repeat protein
LLAQPSSRPYFTQYLADRDEGLRAAAAEGLARLKNPADLPALEKGFGDERKAGTRLSFAFALVMHGRNTLAEFSPLRLLINTLANTMNRRVAQSFLIELARDPRVRGEINRTLLTWAKPEKLGLCTVLASSGDEASAKALEQMVKDPDAEIGAEAARALRGLRGRLR